MDTQAVRAALEDALGYAPKIVHLAANRLVDVWQDVALISNALHVGVPRINASLIVVVQGFGVRTVFTPGNRLMGFTLAAQIPNMVFGFERTCCFQCAPSISAPELLINLGPSACRRCRGGPVS